MSEFAHCLQLPRHRKQILPDSRLQQRLSIKCPESVIGRINFLLWLSPRSSILCPYLSIHRRKTKHTHENTEVQDTREAPGLSRGAARRPGCLVHGHDANGRHELVLETT